ncbi:MAG: AAA family ATPase [Deltaproteobacteria bacterium]|nr:AAA family ATPase [Deltaproteobacteria bacterium]MCX7953157.1 AAA family ATPase [Deltaproteobacteria bacterium]
MTILSGKVLTLVSLPNGSKGFLLEVSGGTKIKVIMDKELKLKEAETISIRGVFSRSPKFGRYFKALDIVNTHEQNVENMVKFLSSGIVKGLGVKYATKIVDYVLKNGLDFETFFSTGWKAIPTVPIKITKQLKNVLEGLSPEKRAQFELLKLGLSLRASEKLVGLYGAVVLSKLSEDPYHALSQLEGYRFKKVDQIAKKLNFDAQNPSRLRFAVEDILKDVLNGGSTCIGKAELIKQVSDLTDVKECDLIEKAIEDLKNLGRIRQVKDDIGFNWALSLEEECGEKLSKRIKNTVYEPDTLKPVNEVSLSDEQFQALKEVFRNNFLIISGGPGTGKTTLVKCIFKAFGGEQVYLASPTGKASQRLSVLCEAEAYTLHRLLKYDPKSGFQKYNEENPLPANCVIVDEASMMDIEILARLLRALPSNCKLIFVGDKDQLPPVSPGNVFTDLLSVPSVPRAYLTKIFRREKGSDINFLARHILDREPKRVLNLISSSNDIKFFPATAHEDAREILTKIVLDDILVNDSHFQSTLILTPSNKGELGADALNQMIANLVLPRPEKTKFVKGDKVIQKKNNYDLNGTSVFNGDTGTVVNVDPLGKSVIVEFWDGRIGVYGKNELDELGLGYCLTVHKAQGQEADTVILVMDRTHYILLNRSLFYTAVTRAKKKLIIISSHKTIWGATLKTDTLMRNTKLSYFLSQKLMQGS